MIRERDMSGRLRWSIGALLCAIFAIASGSATLFGQGNQPVQRTDNTDVLNIAGVSDISTMAPADLAQAIIAAGAAVGLTIDPAIAAAQAQLAIDRGWHAFTISVVTTQVTLGAPNRRADRVQIVTVIGENASETTRDHENGHRSINEILADVNYLTSFMNTLINGANLDGPSVTALMNKKLHDIDIEFNTEWDRLDRTIHPHSARTAMDLQGIAETMAIMKRDVMLAILNRLFLNAAAGGGGILSGLEAELLLKKVDTELSLFGSLIRNLGIMDALLGRVQRDLSGLIDDLLGQ